MSTFAPAALAAELVAAIPSLDKEQQRVALRIYRLLAEGEPVERQRIATAAGITTTRTGELLDQLPGVFLDNHDRVIGFWGLTITPTTHRLLVDDCALYTWCAWDTLFLPELIGKRAHVQSTCPTTGTTVSLSVTGTELTGITPTGAVLSFLHREEPFDADMITTFCHYVHLFADRPAAEQWTAQHDGAFVISLADGAEIARLTNAARFPTRADSSLGKEERR